jgi:hypothetical protein
MLETLLEHPFFLKRHREAPLLKERETFLPHLQQRGTSRAALRNLSGELIRVVRLLRSTSARMDWAGPDRSSVGYQTWTISCRESVGFFDVSSRLERSTQL